MINKICAVIVTYNRKKYLLELLNALKNQTKSIDSILIFDNHSDDGTGELLLQKGIIDSYEMGIVHKKGIYKYYCNDINSGGSGGFYNGMKMAYESGYKYLWCMDDDVLPEKDCLENLLKYMSKEIRVSIPSRTDEKFEDHAVIALNQSNPFLYHINSRKKIITNSQIENDIVYIEDMPFEGPLIDTSLIREIGLPNSELFIIFDDTEYATRAKKVTKLVYCKNAILHKQIVPSNSANLLMGWKEYYAFRNQIWFDTIYGENFWVKFFRPRFLILDLIFRAIIKRKSSNVKVLIKAYKDGIQGRLGKRVEPGTKGENF